MKTGVIIGLLLYFLTGQYALAQKQIVTKNATLSFFSSAPIEDIKAVSNSGYSVLDLQNNSIYFKVEIRTFKFRKGLMQEHFNENYMESDKYPYAEFKGKFLDPVDLSKDGEYTLKVQGDLLVHNVRQNYTTNVNMTVKNGMISGTTTFQVKIADHNIKIPTLLIKNIAEVVDVTVKVVYENGAKKI